MSSMQLPLLSIVGPTAVGKTDASLWLAEQLVAAGLGITGVDLVVADSRQVYRGLEIVTGADVPATFVEQQYQLPTPLSLLPSTIPIFTNQSTTLWGAGLLNPDQEWSVNHFIQLVETVVAQAMARQRLVVLVGGTGLYHNMVANTDPKREVPPDPAIRERAEFLELAELQAWLQRVAPQKWLSMNHSDQSNPRRLVRALEIASAVAPEPSTAAAAPATSVLQTLPHLYIGLRADLPILEARIAERVAARWQAGAVAEVEQAWQRFAAQGTVPPRHQSVWTATGVKEILGFLHDELSEEQAQAVWAKREFQYAKRQFTWWKKQAGLVWFEALEEDCRPKMLSWFRQELVY